MAEMKLDDLIATRAKAYAERLTATAQKGHERRGNSHRLGT